MSAPRNNWLRKMCLEYVRRNAPGAWIAFQKLADEKFGKLQNSRLDQKEKDVLKSLK